MSKHKHADLIKAKVDNMELVVFYSDTYDQSGKWQETSQLPMQEEFKYFLCLPQHKKACLHWLNGGETQMHADNRYFDIEMCESTPRWSARRIFMNDRANTRIKPRKEKRWIAINIKNHDVCLCHEEDKPPFGYQIVEIEVEVY